MSEEENQTIFGRLRSWLHEYTAPEDDGIGDIDIEHLQSESVSYRYMTIRDDGAVRCDLCGNLEQLKNMPEMFEHVATHDGQGQAKVDPTESPKQHDKI